MRSALSCALAFAAVACSKSKEPVPVRPSPVHSLVYGVPAFDELAPWLLEEDDRYRDGARRMRSLSAATIKSLPIQTRVALQNDAWGLVQRIARTASSADGAAELREAASALVWGLAPTMEELARIDGTELPAAVRGILPLHEGFQEFSSEHRVLGHERAFGMRRAFRIMLAFGQHALVSQLIALDREGRAHLTNIVGEIEILQFGGPELLAATVLHLDRAALLKEGADSLVVADHITQIPSEGALSPIITFSPPARVADLPCARCHRDASMMSLPTETEKPETRLKQVLLDAQELRPARVHQPLSR